MAPRTGQPSPEYIDEHHQRISEFGAEYFDDDDEREAFVSELMTRRGYRARTRTDWEPPEEDESKSGPKSNGSQQRQKPAYFKR